MIATYEHHNNETGETVLVPEDGRSFAEIAGDIARQTNSIRYGSYTSERENFANGTITRTFTTNFGRDGQIVGSLAWIRISEVPASDYEPDYEFATAQMVARMLEED